jgi:hypothetical protein
MTGHFLFPGVQERLEWNYRQALRADFVDRMSDEIVRKGCIVVRLHVAGDFATPAYTRKWVKIIADSPQTTFFGYTRSWRIRSIERHLRELAELPNMRLWYSLDRQTGWPTDKPASVRLAWMQDDETVDERADLVFRVRKLRRRELPLVTTACPHETPEGKERGTTCGSCQFCWK